MLCTLQITAFTEIGVMRRLAHMPGICKLHDYGISRHGIYLVMTRYSCSLRTWLAKQTVKPALRLRMYMEIFRQLAELLKVMVLPLPFVKKHVMCGCVCLCVHACVHVCVCIWIYTAFPADVIVAVTTGCCTIFLSCLWTGCVCMAPRQCVSYHMWHLTAVHVQPHSSGQTQLSCSPCKMLHVK